MGLTSFVFIAIVFIVGLMGLLIFKADKKEVQKRPNLLSLIVLGLLVLNWVLYFASFYVVLPQGISEVIFMPIWFILCIAGIVVGLREFRNNYIFAVLSGGLSVISSIFGILLLIIGSM